jgi:predicted 2-oxoglutarate/Fe(II)-dependent dioxygenase YbiX
MIAKTWRESMPLLAANSCLESFIQVKSNVLSHEVCDRLIAEYEDEEWTPSKTIDNLSGFRTSKDINTFNEKYMNNERRIELDNLIYNAINPIILDYSNQFGDFLKIKRDTGYTLLKYEAGDKFKEHVDDIGEIVYDSNGNITRDSIVKRKITLCVALNDKYEGGGLSFFNNTYKPEWKKGEALLFPSCAMFPHQALPVTNGIRYSLITWIE